MLDIKKHLDQVKLQASLQSLSDHQRPFYVGIYVNRGPQETRKASCNLTLDLQQLGKEGVEPKVITKKEVIKTRAEVNEIEVRDLTLTDFK